LFTKALTNLDSDDVLSLQNFESLLPLDWKTLYNVRATNKDYLRIFGEPKEKPQSSRNIDKKKSYIDKMDTLITSVSDVKKPVGGLLSQSVESIINMLKAGKHRNESASFDLRKVDIKSSAWIIGDIAGSLVIKNPSLLSDSENNWLREYNHRTNSINHDHIENLAKKADKNPLKINGVVVIAITGDAKAPVIQSLLNQGLINRLFCDRETAKSLVNLCCP